MQPGPKMPMTNTRTEPRLIFLTAAARKKSSTCARIKDGSPGVPANVTSARGDYMPDGALDIMPADAYDENASSLYVARN